MRRPLGERRSVVTGIGRAGLCPPWPQSVPEIWPQQETLIAAGPVVLPELKKAAAVCCPSFRASSLPAPAGDPWGRPTLYGADTGRAAFSSLRPVVPSDWRRDLEKATVADATSHNWSMGKIVDSASLMNKGLEIEAHYPSASITTTSRS